MSVAEGIICRRSLLVLQLRKCDIVSKRKFFRGACQREVEIKWLTLVLRGLAVGCRAGYWYAAWHLAPRLGSVSNED